MIVSFNERLAEALVDPPAPQAVKLLRTVRTGHVRGRVGIYTSFGPSIPVYTCIYTDTRIYGLNTYDD